MSYGGADRVDQRGIRIVVGQRRVMGSDYALWHRRTMAKKPTLAEIEAAAKRTRERDARDVREGRLHPDALHLIPRELARQSKPVFPAKYRKS